MKIAFGSDLHCGKRMYRTDETGYNKFEHIGYRVLKEYMKAIKDANPDIAVFAGDTFDIPDPPTLPIVRYAQALRILDDIPTMAINGNHDFKFSNRKNKCSATDLVPHTYFADYELKLVEIDDVAFILMPYIYDTVDNIQTYINNCANLAKSTNCSKKILVTHGVTDRYFRDHFVDDPIKLSDEFVQLFDVVVIGHIHTPFEYWEGKTLVISPGGMIDYQAYVDRTGIVLLDTDTMKYERVLVKSPHIIKKNCDESNINKILDNVTEDIYHIVFDGNPEVINNDLFIKAKNKAVNLVIEPVQHEDTVVGNEEEAEIKKSLMPDLYSWVKLNHPDNAEDFEKAKNSL